MDERPHHSPFLAVPPERWLAANALAFAIPDPFPVSPGHALVVPRRVVPTWWEATPAERVALLDLVEEVRRRLDETLPRPPDGYNVGFNAGAAAGQTIPHLHLHVIPRQAGDVPDPRGGIRQVLPGRGDYLADALGQASPSPAIPVIHLSTGIPGESLWRHLEHRLPTARSIDILSSFVQRSGLDLLEGPLFAALRQGARVRILAGDYLHITDPGALRRLAGWESLSASEPGAGSFSARLVELSGLAGGPVSFHPKAWRVIDDGGGGLVAVGSSNLSRAALVDGLEWNLLVPNHPHGDLAVRVAREFETLWNSASALTGDLLDRYAAETAAGHRAHPEPEAEDLPLEIPAPRPWQEKALASLQALRTAGFRRALVTVATGMGKTWLAAFDIRQLGSALGRRPRVLVVAHRAHILAQAESVLDRVLSPLGGPGRTSWYLGPDDDLSGDLVVASVQKLTRPRGLECLARESFDYAVVDEVHHAEAPGYRKVLARLQAGFVLGLTATPERTDGIDVSSIFDDNLAFQATIGEGIAEELLVPFHYLGLKDTVDFARIPWRNGRFDPVALEEQVARSERMDRLAQTLARHPARRTLVFCCSQRHALFVRAWLRDRGLAAAAVFAGPESDPCADSLQALREGTIEFLCAVDMFNEGLDIPAVDRVVMLRPTESKVVFLQQLGRGLRACEGKQRLLVVDFVGNHRVFAQRLRHLLCLEPASRPHDALRLWLEGKPPLLPEGCLLDVELEAKDLLRRFLPSGKAAAREGYRSLRDELGRRPSMAEVFHRGWLPGTLSATGEGWFDFLRSEGDLTDAEQEILEHHADWFLQLETTALNRSYKMVVLRVLLDRGCWWDGLSVFDLALSCRRFLTGHRVLRRDLEGERHALDHARASDEDWADWWTRWPVARWLDLQQGRHWFARGDSPTSPVFRFVPEVPPANRADFERMTEELVEYRLARYVHSHRLTDASDAPLAVGPFILKVAHAGGHPILSLADAPDVPGRPVGPVRAAAPGGRLWDFKFARAACRYAHPSDSSPPVNRLPELLREWFGQDAGLPGTAFQVVLECSGNRWSIQPEFPTPAHAEATVGAITPPIPADRTFVPDLDPAGQFTTHVPVYDLEAAAGGWGPDGSPRRIGWLPVEGVPLRDDMFAARVVGVSMEPKIPSGSWCLFRRPPQGSRQNRLLLVQVNTGADPLDGGRYTVKRYRSGKHATPEGWEHESIELQPLNPAVSPIRLSPDNQADLRVIGEFVRVLG